MKLLMLLISTICTLSAVSSPAATNPAIMWAYVTPIPTVTIPTVSEYQASYGIAIQTYSDDPGIEAYIITVTYRATATGAVTTVQRITLRQDPGTWAPLMVYVSQPVTVVSVRAQGLVTKESNEVGGKL